jgi:hypothetical protein
MKKSFTLVAMLLSFAVFAQSNFPYSYVTEDLDTLYLQRDFELTGEIIKVWKQEKMNGGKVPVIVIVDEKTIKMLKAGIAAVIPKEDIVQM